MLGPAGGPLLSQHDSPSDASRRLMASYGHTAPRAATR